MNTLKTNNGFDSNNSCVYPRIVCPFSEMLATALKKSFSVRMCWTQAAADQFNELIHAGLALYVRRRSAREKAFSSSSLTSALGNQELDEISYELKSINDTLSFQYPGMVSDFVEEDAWMSHDFDEYYEARSCESRDED